METREKGQPVFYYSRERRLEKASPMVHYVVSKYDEKRPGMFKSLTATRPLQFLFFSIVFMSVAFMVVTIIQGNKNSGTVAGNSIKGTALWFDDQVYVTITRKGQKLSQSAKRIEISVAENFGSLPEFLEKDDPEIRFRFTPAAKLKSITINALVPGSTGEKPSVLKLLVKVE
jgi:hypothetical protein